MEPFEGTLHAHGVTARHAALVGHLVAHDAFLRHTRCDKHRVDDERRRRRDTNHLRLWSDFLSPHAKINNDQTAKMWSEVTTRALRKVRSYLPSSNPSTLLGRWCGPWYNRECNTMLKGSYADMDNSLGTRTPRKVDTAKTTDRSARNPITVFSQE